VVAYDYGIKQNILRRLWTTNAKVYVVSRAQTSAVFWRTFWRMKRTESCLSNGPGDREPGPYAVENIKKNLLATVPVFGIAWGTSCAAWR